MTSETRARETPASRATSSIVTYDRRPLPAEGTASSMTLERSKDRLHWVCPLCYGRAVRALQQAGVPRRNEKLLEQRMRARHLAGAPISWGVCEVPGWVR